jgi:very-short-patch-repair endonuclease
MSRSPFVPRELVNAPFDLATAREFGLTEDHLRGKSWRRVARGMFAWHEIADGSIVKLQAALNQVPDGSVLSGLSAGWLHGLDLPPCSPIEVTVPIASRVSRRAGLSIHRSAEIERTLAKGLPVTSRERTITDLAGRAPLIEAVVVLDMALHRRMATTSVLIKWVGAHPGRRGIATLRQAIELAEPKTESPMETRLRMLLVLEGLPRPRVQVPLYDTTGTFVGRPDLYYPRKRLALEYDGSIHRDSLAADDRRQNRLVDAGYRVLRFTAGDVLSTRAATVAIVRRALALPG